MYMHIQPVLIMDACICIEMYDVWTVSVIFCTPSVSKIEVDMMLLKSLCVLHDLNSIASDSKKHSQHL